MSDTWCDLASAPLRPDTRFGTLSIEGVSLFTTRWTITSLAQLYRNPELRGSDRIIPGVAGVIPYLRRATVTRYSLPLVVSGYDGASDPYVGTAAALHELSAICRPTNEGDGTRSAVFTMPHGPSVTAQVHVIGLNGDFAGPYWTGTFELSDPTGTLNASGVS
jgi:hypothetical protein